MIYICGLLMALADSVPGVSGGTIAYLLGYYEDFINSLNSFMSRKGDKLERKENLKKSFKFLIRLGIGWIVGFISAVLILTSVFESHIYQISSLFIGFIVFSIPLIVYEEKESLKKFYNVVFLILGAALVVAITMVNPSDGGSVSAGAFNIGQLIYTVLVGMIAISAMVSSGYFRLDHAFDIRRIPAGYECYKGSAPFGFQRSSYCNFCRNRHTAWSYCYYQAC